MKKMGISGLLLLGMTALMLSSCGSQGPAGGADGGNTVVISAATQDGTATSVLSSLGTPPFTVDTLKYTITSTVYPGVTSILPSPVQITRQHVSFVPLPDSNGALSPPLPSFDETATGTVTPGGTLNMEIGVIEPVVKQYVYNNYLSQLTSTVSQFKYSIVIDFIGVETNTGTSVSCRAYSNAFISQ